MQKSFYVLCAVILFSIVTSCRKDKDVITDTSANIAFSADTVMFDTVFTTVGSATQSFLIYNHHTQPINISSIYLGGGSSSYYRLNVDGSPGKSFANVQIGANDSLWIFIEVTINPNNRNTPFIVDDSIVFVTNGNMQKVKLVAFGQNAHFHGPKPRANFFFVLDSNPVINWVHNASDSLPHVIYGYALVQPNQTLNIDKGTNVYFHPGSGLVVMSLGTLNVTGTKDEPVSFLNDRLGVTYNDIPGQWDRIWLSSLTFNDLAGGHDIAPSAKNCAINYAIIKNSFVGLQVDTAVDNSSVTLQLDNSIVENCAGVALLGQGSTIRCTNSIFANCGQYLAALAYGGDYNFRHCTFANYWENDNRQTPSIYINNYFQSGSTTYLRPIRNAYFGNCIIYGNMPGEIGLDSLRTPGNNFNFMFAHSLLNISDTLHASGYPGHYDAVTITLLNSDPQFTDPTVNNYVQKSTAIGNDSGDPAITNATPAILLDIRGNTRIQSAAPDLGPYEVR